MSYVYYTSDHQLRDFAVVGLPSSLIRPCSLAPNVEARITDMIDLRAMRLCRANSRDREHVTGRVS